MGVCATSGGMSTTTRSCKAWTTSCRWTSTCPAARRGRRCFIDAILKLHDKIINTKLGQNRERQITDLEQAKLGMQPLHMTAPEEGRGSAR